MSAFAATVLTSMTFCSNAGAFMSNATALALKVRPYLESSHISAVYVSTDTCDMFDALKSSSLLGFGATVLYSPCQHAKAPSRGKPDDTLRLIAEIEMMRNGVYFFGLMRSNLCSTVYLLRHTRQQKNTINFIPCDCIERIEVFENGGQSS